MAVLPAHSTATTSESLIPRRSTIRDTRSFMSSTTRAWSRAGPSRSAAMMRRVTSSPYARWELYLASASKVFPELRSRRCATTVEVPTSTATP